MPEQFKFHRNNSTVIAGLTRNEIQAVTVWQGDSDFQFEFHTQHEAGWPCYLREPDGPNRNLPKLNLKGDAWTGTFLQGSSVRDQDKATEFRNVITANLAAFRKLAQRFYEGVEEVKTSGPAWFVKFSCTKAAKQAKPVYVRMPSEGQNLGAAFWSKNRQTKATKPTCTLHKNKSDCLDVGVPEQLQAQQAMKQTWKFDDSLTPVGG